MTEPGRSSTRLTHSHWSGDSTLGEHDLSVGIVSSIQTHGSLANWHPHLHLLVTDGGFRPDGNFVRLPLHDVATLTEAFRRAVLRMFVTRELLDSDTAQSMLAWPHAGFHVHDGVRATADDMAFTVRLARYCARNPLALGRLAYDEQHGAVTYHSDKPTGPTAGRETTDALAFLARVTSHIPDKGQVLQRYYGWYSSRQRGARRRAAGEDVARPRVMVDPEPEALRAAKRRRGGGSRWIVGQEGTGGQRGQWRQGYQFTAPPAPAAPTASEH